MTELVGAGALAKLALRRDRVMIPIWVYALVATAASTAYSFGKLYDTAESRLDFAAGIRDNPSTLALYGPSTPGKRSAGSPLGASSGSARLSWR
jgi:ABC-2 type transport system permease protein